MISPAEPIASRATNVSLLHLWRGDATWSPHPLVRYCLGLRPVSLLGIALSLSLVFLPRASEGQSWGRALKTASVPDFGVYVTGAGANTQFPYYADNAVGFVAGAFLQPSLFGIEARTAAYPVSAKFMQAPTTIGLRIGSHLPQSRWDPYAYLGGGFSRAQDSNAQFAPSAAAWSPCWQVALGEDIRFGRFSLRLAEVTWTETYTSRRQLHTASFSTGIIFRP